MIITDLDSPNILEPRAIVGTKTESEIHEGICGKNFFIPSYQRGYRWDEQQVTQLLRDLCEFFYEDNNRGEFYCLQPIVVKEITDETRKQELGLPKPDEPWYEVIDGQQRLTTIRIILALFRTFSIGSRKNTFRIHYQTRPQLGEIFNHIDKEILNPDQEDEDEKYRAVFREYQSNDIDSWHILNAANHVLNYFQDNPSPGISISAFTGDFHQYFTNPATAKKSVQVIWYELKDNDETSATALFKRLNEMCIKLNNAELIRALFLSDSARYKTDPGLLSGISDPIIKSRILSRERNRKQSHIISQWDVIEQRLRDPKLWAFISNDVDASNTAKYNCRIEYIFDLISGKSETDRDPLATLIEFERMASASNTADPLWDLWSKVELYFSTILAWYADRDMYHRIGYLIADKGWTILINLLDKASKLSKHEFADEIHSLISGSVSLPKGKTDIEQLSYQDKTDYIALRKLLFLFNVETTRLSESEPFFPFDRYKQQQWSLEHIHAQNSDLIDQSDRDKWKDFISTNLTALKHLQARFNGSRLDPSETITRLECDLNELNKSKTYTFTKFQMLFDILSDYYDKLAESRQRAEKLHSISNMALLSGRINSSIGNSVFEVKRQKIIEMDAQGEYIPLCTRKVFLKYYNKEDNDFQTAQAFYWGEQDRINYLRHLNDILSPFLNDSTNK